MLCAKFGWNWPSGSGEEVEFFLILSMYFCYFEINSPWKRGASFEQTWIPLAQGCIVPSLVKIGPEVLEKKIFKIRQFFFAISLLSPLWKGRELHLNNLSPNTQEYFVPSLVKIGQWFWRRRYKCEKFTTTQTTTTTTTTTTTDNGKLWSEKHTSEFSSGELKRVPG